MPLAARVDEPDKVGLDRLANALAADRLRAAERGAIVVDLGSAITVDVVSPDGAFLGGAILPGIAMSARALHEFTDLLPLEPMSELAQPPAAVGKDDVGLSASGALLGGHRRRARTDRAAERRGRETAIIRHRRGRGGGCRLAHRGRASHRPCWFPI